VDALSLEPCLQPDSEVFDVEVNAVTAAVVFGEVNVCYFSRITEP
jgi:hypothetical protein